jgi:hypothetical protein
MAAIFPCCARRTGRKIKSNPGSDFPDCQQYPLDQSFRSAKRGKSAEKFLRLAGSGNALSREGAGGGRGHFRDRRCGADAASRATRVRHNRHNTPRSWCQNGGFSSGRRSPLPMPAIRSSLPPRATTRRRPAAVVTLPIPTDHPPITAGAGGPSGMSRRRWPSTVSHRRFQGPARRLPRGAGNRRAVENAKGLRSFAYSACPRRPLR